MPIGKRLILRDLLDVCGHPLWWISTTLAVRAPKWNVAGPAQTRYSLERLRRSTQPGLTTWCARPNASAPAGTSSVTTEPAPT